MTVCIGAMCQVQGEIPISAIVVAADRMVTLADFMKFEHDVPKVSEITTSTLALTAGDTLRGATLVRRLKEVFRIGTQSTLDVARTAAATYEYLRREQIDIEIFKLRGFTMRDFYTQGLQNTLLPSLVGLLDSQVSGFNYGVECLIAGVDGSGSHLYGVGNPGDFTDYEPIGYAAIGSGGIHAVQSMIGFNHTGARSLFETLYTVYASKVRAEVAPGVGTFTDMYIILPHTSIHLTDQQLKQLDTLYQQNNQPISPELEQKVQDLQLFKTEETNGNTQPVPETEPTPESGKSNTEANT